ncbi:MerR family transcriptional regulator [Lampropedia aestuarii]|uniref:MerR family transcriptional regulator n=1 Tax=Lampropedia aestuarii TaxID=2562762 RepID=A0A4S5BVH6_9BURK|nr:MerR family transcriptional regulator [Lampropedia aestuarii]MDH5858892.1 MerR family transcriptional regulator [Lampropedia aestuarii]THJ35181.1 MerR family transcriptional regulator [Lampropedia aestuarii]
MNTIHLTIGAVAKRAGMTVRTLHHYDHIGLVCPSARSASGYRLYSAGDIERLHAVQSLKKLGLSLEAIATTLTGGEFTPQVLLRRQIEEVTRKLLEIQELKEKLLFLEQAISSQNATADDLLNGIRLLETHQLYLPSGDIRRLLGRWRRARPRWLPIAEELLSCQRNAIPSDAARTQLLAQRWMNIAMSVFGGRLGVILDWVRMHREAPETARHAGLETELMQYLEQAIELRLAALRRHLLPEELNRLDGSTGPEWEALAARGERLLASGVSPKMKAARELLEQYRELSLRTVSQDMPLATKLRQAYACEPILALGHFVGPRLRAYLDAAAS